MTGVQIPSPSLSLYGFSEPGLGERHCPKCAEGTQEEEATCHDFTVQWAELDKPFQTSSRLQGSVERTTGKAQLIFNRCDQTVG